jgi:hypothetical protein
VAIVWKGEAFGWPSRLEMIEHDSLPRVLGTPVTDLVQREDPYVNGESLELPVCNNDVVSGGGKPWSLGCYISATVYGAE